MQVNSKALAQDAMACRCAMASASKGHCVTPYAVRHTPQNAIELSEFLPIPQQC